MRNNGALEFKAYKTAPLFMAALSFVFGAAAAVKFFRFPEAEIFFGARIPTYAIAVILFTLIAAAGSLFGIKRKAAPVLFAAIAVAGFFAAQMKIETGYEKEGIIPHTRIEAEVADMKENGANSISLILKDVRISSEDGSEQPLKGRVSLILYGQSAAFLRSEFSVVGSAVAAQAETMYPSGPAEYGFMSERLRLLSQNVFYKAVCHYSALEVIEEEKPPVLYAFFNGMRESLDGSLERYAGGDEAGFLQAIITGSKSGLDASIKSDFNQLGISHILATSGLHIGILLLFFAYIFKKTRTPAIFRAVVSAAVILAFVCFAGFRSSMLRAAFMWGVIMASGLFGKKINPLNSLGFAMLVMAVFNPLCAVDISFILSCVSVAAIALFADRINNAGKMRKSKKVLGAAFVTLAVVAFTWPVTAYYFNSVPVLSFVFNIIFVPLSGLALFAGLLFGVLSGVGFIAPVLGAAAKALSHVIIETADFLAGFSPAINLVSPPFAAVAFWMAGAAVLSGALVSGKKKLMRILSACALAAAVIIMAAAQMQAAGRTSIKAYPDGSVTFLYLEDGKRNALILNDDSYIASAVLKKDAEKKLDMLIYSGNDCETLSVILDDLKDFDIGTVYAAGDVALGYNAQNGAYASQMGVVGFAGCEIELIPFKAKSKTAKTHYAAVISDGPRSILYLDPISLREGAFGEAQFSDAVSSRWTKSRAQNIGFAHFERLYYSSGGYAPYESALLLERDGVKTYNIIRAVELPRPEGDR